MDKLSTVKEVNSAVTRAMTGLNPQINDPAKKSAFVMALNF
jgi:hypothetical protein